MALPLRISRLTKVYKSGRQVRKAVDNLSLDVPGGVVFGFLGPNGAGKTTTIKTALNFLAPTSGEVEIFGVCSTNPESRKEVGYLPEQPYFPRFLSPKEVLRVHAALAGVPRRRVQERVEQALHLAMLEDYANTPIAKLSKGLSQRVGLAQALVGEPRLLILDEPTSGLDPVGRRHVRDLLLRLKSEGKTIFLSSHLLSEVEQVCDYIAVLRRGQLVYTGKPEDAKSPSERFLITVTPLTNELVTSLESKNVDVDTRPGCAVVAATPDNFYTVVRELESTGARILDVQAARETMEEAFIRLAA